ncbi:MAG: flavodoxin family protein [Solobacterium sp.]|nr:flavodoxin family protein [Solobacterium sp.]
MTISVIYNSRENETDILAETIARRCETEAIDISRRHTLPETDLLFVGMSTYKGKPDEAILDYLDQLPVNRIRNAAIFSTHIKGVDKTELAVSLLEHKGIRVFPEHYVCEQGRFFSKQPDVDDIGRLLAFTARVLDTYGDEQ